MDPEQILPPWRWGWRNWIAILGLSLFAWWVLRPRAEFATVEPMPTVAAKKPSRKTASPRRAVKAPKGMAVSSVTGLYYKPLRPGQKPVSRDALKAALADSL